MFKFKVGDRVKVISQNMSASGKRYDNRIGIILSLNNNYSPYGCYYLLDIDARKGGIWECELELVDASQKEVKVYSIVKFCKKYYK